MNDRRAGDADAVQTQALKTLATLIRARGALAPLDRLCAGGSLSLCGLLGSGRTARLVAPTETDGGTIRVPALSRTRARPRLRRVLPSAPKTAKHEGAILGYRCAKT
jgi:hypothetical protein